MGEMFGSLPHKILSLGIYEFTLAWKAAEAVWESRATDTDTENGE